MSPRRKLLRDEGLVETIEAEDRDAHPDLLRRVRGKTVAVDLSIWIFEATSQLLNTAARACRRIVVFCRRQSRLSQSALCACQKRR